MPIRIHNLQSSFTSALDVSSFRIHLPQFNELDQLARPSFRIVFLANGDRKYELKSSVIPVKAIAYLFMGALLLSVATPFFRRTDLLAYTGWQFIVSFGFLMGMGFCMTVKGIGLWAMKQSISFENGKMILYKSRLFFPVIFEIPLQNIEGISFEDKWFFRDTVYQEAIPMLNIGKHKIPFFEWASDETADEMNALISDKLQQEKYSWTPAMGQTA